MSVESKKNSKPTIIDIYRRCFTKSLVAYVVLLFLTLGSIYWIPGVISMCDFYVNGIYNVGIVQLVFFIISAEVFAICLITFLFSDSRSFFYPLFFDFFANAHFQKAQATRKFAKIARRQTWSIFLIMTVVMLSIFWLLCRFLPIGILETIKDISLDSHVFTITLATMLVVLMILGTGSFWYHRNKLLEKFDICLAPMGPLSNILSNQLSSSTTNTIGEGSQYEYNNVKKDVFGRLVETRFKSSIDPKVYCNERQAFLFIVKGKNSNKRSFIVETKDSVKHYYKDSDGIIQSKKIEKKEDSEQIKKSYLILHSYPFNNKLKEIKSLDTAIENNNLKIDESTYEELTLPKCSDRLNYWRELFPNDGIVDKDEYWVIDLLSGFFDGVKAAEPYRVEEKTAEKTSSSI